MQELLIPDSLNSLLHNWATWQRQDGLSRGYPSRSAGFSSGGWSTPSDTFDLMAEGQDQTLAKVIDVILDSLGAEDRAAVYHHFTGSLYRYPDDPVGRIDKVVKKLLILTHEKGIT